MSTVLTPGGTPVAPAAPASTAPAWSQIATILAGSIITILPTALPLIPAPFGELASAALAGIVALWHLYQPSPTAPVAAVTVVK